MNKPRRFVSPLIAFIALALLAASLPVFCADLNDIVQQTRQVENLSPVAKELIVRLEAEVSKIIKAGHLMPFRVQYGEGRARNLYAEPWMMMFTLARAYPYVAKETQAAITVYLRKESQLYPPWSKTALGLTGAYRQGDPKGVPELGLPPKYKPTGDAHDALQLLRLGPAVPGQRTATSGRCARRIDGRLLLPAKPGHRH